MLWKLFQTVVFFTVYFAGIYYEWTPNGYVLGLLSLGAAFFSTLALSELFLLLSRTFKAANRLLGKQRIEHRPPRWR
jgi:hypothetical protein